MKSAHPPCVGPHAASVESLRRVHRLHALATTLLPALATLYAAWTIAAGDARAWQVGLAAAMYVLTTLAITVGYHRLLAHHAFVAADPVKRVLLVLAGMAAQGPPAYWVGNHRQHHRFADGDGDPHSPRVDGSRRLGRWAGFWHAHLGWIFAHARTDSTQVCPDLLRDPIVRFASRYYFVWVALGLLLPGLAGLCIAPGWAGFAQGVIWGGAVRMFLTNQLTHAINSAAHLWGTRRFETRDTSRNNWFLGIFTLGEGWHNNHHANGTRAVFSRAWYEVDVGGAFILLLAALGLASCVRRGSDLGPRVGDIPEPLAAVSPWEDLPMNAITTCAPTPVTPHPPAAAPGPDEALAFRRVVDNGRLRRLQHMHTVAMTGLGAAGLLAAVALHVLVRPVSGAAAGIGLLFFLLVGLGLTIGYHRHFTHKSYVAPTWLRVSLAILGSMAGQGPVVFWTALHRMHHELADKPGDPHSPNLHGSAPRQRLRGLAHAYIGWTTRHEVPNANFYARDLLANAPIMWVNKRYHAWIVLGWLLPAALGWLFTGAALGALEAFLWGGLARMFLHHNMIWTITSFAHVVGTRDYVTRDLSTNNAWLALPTLGESWHNNHHAFPRAAILSLRAWQLDPSGLVISLLEKLGVVTEVCRVAPSERDTRAVAARRPR